MSGSGNKLQSWEAAAYACSSRIGVRGHARNQLIDRDLVREEISETAARLDGGFCEATGSILRRSAIIFLFSVQSRCVLLAVGRAPSDSFTEAAALSFIAETIGQV